MRHAGVVRGWGVEAQCKKILTVIGLKTEHFKTALMAKPLCSQAALGEFSRVDQGEPAVMEIRSETFPDKTARTEIFEVVGDGAGV